MNRARRVYQNVLETIGETPLIRLNKVAAGIATPVYVKAEFFNPGGSVKDRAALNMILEGERSGQLSPDKIILDATSGNTGIAYAMIAAARGYRVKLCLPASASIERTRILRAFGAELVLTDPAEGSDGAIRKVRELYASDPERYFYPDQYNNPANWRAHYQTTANEIWEQTGGRIDGFTCAIGTGGTIAGVSSFLKEKNNRIRTVAADPMGAAMYSWFKRKELKAEGSSVTEGIGLGRVTKNVEGARVDDAYQIPDSEALPLIFDLLKNEGLCLGGSSAINVAGAIRLAKELGPGHTVVTILADSGTRYQSKLFNPRFLKEKGLPCPDWL